MLLLLFLFPKTELKAEDKKEKPLDYLVKRLFIYYVPNPNKAKTGVYLLSTTGIRKGDTLSAAGDFWHNPKLKHARSLVLGLLRPSNNGGNVSLQQTAYDIMKIQDKDVQVWIYNDKVKINKYTRDQYDPCEDENGYVWPCAGNFDDDENESNLFAGYMHLGVKNMNKKGKEWTYATFIHELMHTQDKSDIRAHIFYSYSTEKWYHYGKDGDHYYQEAVPSTNSAYGEGIANTLSLIFDPEQYLVSFTWFANNGDLWVETKKDRKAKDIPARAWLYDRIKKVAGPGRRIKDMDDYRAYKIRDLPARYIIHNEMIIAMIFSQYGLHVNDYKFLKAIKKSNKEYNERSSSIANIFKNMCEAGLPKGETPGTVLETDAPMTYLLPLAYADYFTGYNAKTIKEFNAIFEYKIPWVWVDMYWKHGRELVRNRIPIDDPTYYPVTEDLTDIAMTLGIIENVAESMNE